MKKIMIPGFIVLLVVSGLFFSFASDDYPQNLRKKELDEVIDPWKFYNRECTSFVAWCLNSRNGVAFDNFYMGEHWGDAADWAGVAEKIGIRVDNIPAVGAVAWWGGAYGHVAYVVDVSDGGITIEDYNSYEPGAYDKRHISLHSVDKFIHFGGNEVFLKDRATRANQDSYEENPETGLEEGAGEQTETENDSNNEKTEYGNKEQPAEFTGSTVNEVGFTKSFSYQIGQFSDVTDSDWFEPWVGKAAEYGLVKGGSDGRFHPMGDISYAELITIAARMHSIYYNNPIEERGYEWYEKYFYYAVNYGIIDDDYLDPVLLKEKANRSDSVGILSRVLPQEAFASKNKVSDSAIPDVKMDDANSSPIYNFYRAGILSGSDATGRFHPLKFITRAEISKIIVSMVEEKSRKSFELLNIER